MALNQRKRAILFKLEPTYGVDPTPAASDAVLVRSLDLKPMEGNQVERDFIRPYFGASGAIRTENYVTLSFETEIAGSGTAGTPPGWGALLKAAGFSETITAAPVTGTAQTTGSTTSAITLAAGASAVHDFYDGMTVSLTGGTGVGQKGEIISYNGTTKVAGLSGTWAVAPDATTQYSIGENVLYLPVSTFGASSSATIHFYLDGVRHVLLGARGSVSFELSAKQLPVMKWSFTGLMGTVSDVAMPSSDTSAWQTPVTISTENTTDLNLLGYRSAVLSTLSIDMANQVVYRQLVGGESVIITDRKPAGNVSIEATTVTAKDWWTTAKNATTGAFYIKHGQAAGNSVSFTSRKVQLTQPQYSDLDGIAMMDFGTAFIPFSSTGNDELRICVK
jgi:hypothetical protein